MSDIKLIILIYDIPNAHGIVAKLVQLLVYRNEAVAVVISMPTTIPSSKARAYRAEFSESFLELGLGKLAVSVLVVSFENLQYLLLCVGYFEPLILSLTLVLVDYIGHYIGHYTLNLQILQEIKAEVTCLHYEIKGQIYTYI